MTPDGSRLHLVADLSLEVDGSPARITADGSELTVTADDVPGFVRGVREAAAARNGTRPGRADLRALAGALSDAGITARLVTPTRPVVTVGAGVDSAVGRVLLSTRRARPETSFVLAASRRARGIATAAAGLAVAALVVRRRLSR